MNNNLALEIEKHTQRKMHTHRDFVWLSEQVKMATAEHVSATTLKRVWGFQKDYDSPSHYTLNLLSRYLGYADYDSFVEGKPNEQSTSSIKAACYMACNLTSGDELTLTWAPNRCIVVHFLEGCSFKVVEAVNSKLQVGDTFSCQTFIEGEACCLSNLYRGEAGPYACVIGKQGGISIATNYPPNLLNALNRPETSPRTVSV